jgi:hypothetical protein
MNNKEREPSHSSEKKKKRERESSFKAYRLCLYEIPNLHDDVYLPDLKKPNALSLLGEASLGATE